MDAKELVKELREYISEEKARWAKHRDRNKQFSNSHAAYNGRVWMLGAVQEKLKTISRRKGFLNNSIRQKKSKETRVKNLQQTKGTSVRYHRMTRDEFENCHREADLGR